MHKRWSFSTPTPSSHTPSPSCMSIPLCITASPEVSPQPNRETVAIFLWPADWPFVGCLLRQQLSSARSAFAGWLGRLPAAARLSPQLAFRKSPSGATGAGAGTAAAEAEAAWCRDRGQGGGYLSLFMTGSDPERVNFTSPAQPRCVKIGISLKKPQSPRRAKTNIYAGCYRKGTVFRILTSKAIDWFMVYVWVELGFVDMSKSQRLTRSGAGRG
jgi:hypothetical protein